jgi:inorganic triphosphatase YgiF
LAIEREYKFTLPDASARHELVDRYRRSGWTVTPLVNDAVLRSQYFDSAQRRLFSLGVGFRFRSHSLGEDQLAAQQGVWCLKAVPLDRSTNEHYVSRMEWEHPGVAAHPPGSFYPALAAYVGGAVALEPLVTVVVYRSDYEVIEGNAKVVVSYDEIYLGESDAAPTYRELEIEFGGGSERLARALADDVLENGARASASNKLEAAVGKHTARSWDEDGLRARLVGDLLMELSFSEQPSSWFSAARRAYLMLTDDAANRAHPVLVAALATQRAPDRRDAIAHLFRFVELLEHLDGARELSIAPSDDQSQRRATEFEGMAPHGPAD